MDENHSAQADQGHLRYRKLVENLPGCVVLVLDQNLRVTFAGGAEMQAGFRPQFYRGRPAAEVVDASVYAYVEPYLLATLRGAETNFELDYPAGPSFEVRTTPLQEDPGAATEILVIVLDTTLRKRAEAAERAAQRVLEQAVRAANVGLWDVDLQSRRVHYSHEWKQQLGCEDKEIGDSLDEWTNRLHPDDLVQARNGAFAYLATPGPNYEQEFRLRHKDGSYRWILARGTVCYDGAGQPAHALGVHIDITEKKLAEVALRAGERQQRELAESLATERDRLAAVLESLPVGVWISAQDGRVVAKNRQTDLIWHGEAPLPASVEEYTNYVAWDAVTGEQLAPADYPAARVLRTGEPAAPRELRIQRFDGTEGAVLVSAVPLHDRGGNSAGVVSVNVDITEKKQAEDALRASEAALRKSQAVAHVGHWQWDLGGGTAVWSDELKRIIGVEPTMFGERWAEMFQRLVHPDDQARLGEERGGLLRDSKALQTEVRVMRPDGEVCYLWAAIDEAGCDAAGNIIRRSGVVQDITERKLREIEREQMQDQLQRQAQLAAVGQLAAGIAHDFNNIMSVISVYAEMASEAPGLTEKERARTQTIVEQTQRATRMIRQILDFSRQAVYERQPLDLLPLLKEEARLLRQTLPENIEIMLEAAPGEYIVLADPTRMQQLLMNLALNARDAMPDGGTLQVSLGRMKVATGRQARAAGLGRGDWVQVVVSDTGGGIRPEHLAHIFEPFYTTKEHVKGTGLGLAQVQGIVAQHEGQITVASEPDAGTIFTIYLPAAAAPVLGEDLAAVDAMPQGHGKCVLLVEDDGDVRASLAALLEGCNYKVVQATNGQEALACLARPPQQVDVILSDVVMPRLGGIGLVKALRKEGVTIPVILMSGYAGGETRAAIKEVGEVAWLDKPPSSAALARALAVAGTGRG